MTQHSRDMPGRIEDQALDAYEPLEFYRVDRLTGTDRSSSTDHHYFESRKRMEEYVLHSLIDQHGYWASRQNKGARAASSSIRWACKYWFDRVLLRDQAEPRMHTLEIKRICQLRTDGEWHEIFYKLYEPTVVRVREP